MNAFNHHAADIAWWLMTRSIRFWVNHYMDQFENFRFKSDYGYPTYVSITYHSDSPEAFEDLDDPCPWLKPTIDNPQ